MSTQDLSKLTGEELLREFAASVNFTNDRQGSLTVKEELLRRLSLLDSVTKERDELVKEVKFRRMENEDISRKLATARKDVLEEAAKEFEQTAMIHSNPHEIKRYRDDAERIRSIIDKEST